MYNNYNKYIYNRKFVHNKVQIGINVRIFLKIINALPINFYFFTLHSTEKVISIHTALEILYDTINIVY